ncbi:hypothetical protein PQR62_20995 [Herbaspirillum lusitanum]|jgi:hypothetical protein|uniref:Uncharacterized protein n=1 Tax=Herbaspirillum lusitanum TaxID=213312 RepID=A0ABW9AET6_9BURK
MKILSMLIAFLLAAGLSASASADPSCQLNLVGDKKVIQTILSLHKGHLASEEICDLLHDNGLSLSVTGQASVSSGIAFGWASVRLVDDAHLYSESFSSTTVTDKKKVSMARANELMNLSFESAVQDFRFLEATQQIKSYRAALKK